MAKKTSTKYNLFSKEAWTFVCLTVLCLGILFFFIDLTPHVDYDVFFSPDDPSYKADVEISRLFPRNDSQLIISVTGNIYSSEYKEKMKKLGDHLSELNHVSDVKSIMHGPKNVEDATKSPFWRRLLIPDHKQSSNIVLIFDNSIPIEKLDKVILKIENLKFLFEAKDFKIHISGFPYIVDLINPSSVVNIAQKDADHVILIASLVASILLLM